MANKKVLYGDDKPEMREKVARELRSRGLEVDLASTPSEMLAKAKSSNYHVLITDLEYTQDGREGYEVLGAIRYLPGLKILYSGVSGFEYQAEALENGADFAVLRKDLNSLLEMLDKNLKEEGKNGK
jgi:DNA-binding NtrC family response regulator